VPSQGFGVGATTYIGRGIYLVTMKRVVVPPVVELLLDAPAHLEAQIGRDGHIARIEQAVDVAPKQEAV
jgi:hypothetical protein